MCWWKIDVFKCIEIRKYPHSIPHDHHISTIVRDLHNATHLGTEWTVSLLRAKYWITKVRVVVKRVKNDCIVCKKVTPRCLWPLGSVTEVKVGQDDLVRSVKVKTRSTYLVRPITKIVMFESIQGAIKIIKL